MTDERLLERYRVERELSDRLRHASPLERRQLYAEVYDELFRRLPDHPQLQRKASAAARMENAAAQLIVLRRYLHPGTRFLEIGAGDCALSLEVARHVREVCAVDVSERVASDFGSPPPHFRTVLSDGCSLPVPSRSFDVVYSNQVMEHLHPDDAAEQLKEVVRVLDTGGCYLCITPNRLNGPHDVSRFFDQEATGFHLREYTNGMLACSFLEAGFSRVSALVGTRGRYLELPLAPLACLEWSLDRLPGALRLALARRQPLRGLLTIRLVGWKQAAAE
jgi:SAM-dependent methyltransferase